MASKTATHILYYNAFSLNSTMARYAFALRGALKPGQSEITIQEEPLDIGLKREQLTEHYLVDINPKGEVPVLAPVSGGPTLPDSVEITFKFGEVYEDIIPETQAGQIRELLDRLHKLGIFSLTMGPRPGVGAGQTAVLEEKLKGDISDKYRAALKEKLEQWTTVKVPSLTKEGQEKSAADMKAYLGDIDSLLSKSETAWLLSTTRASALDAHVVPLVARMLDIKQDGLVPESVAKYAASAMQGQEWNAVMQGRTTLPPMPPAQK
ncbi:hypothetical protein J7T55_0148127 [Diaporthe amygdali]|uniref:uncharacterized protein n=1 Tax=Phomopsis amygdali TaxID=1214568 RepID=UPI0022FDC3FD|nr:uncharacterized protein J7T55_0148127 [Diaporthe amygdali]KAJ0110010.1 hypothetical protein J7T55_0148127 [Diaporthe amygdali]